MLTAIILFIIQFGCAVQSPPSGGPEDKTPPEVLEVFPARDELNVPFSTEVSLTFSERMDKTSVEKAFFISPQPESYPEFKWKGTRLLIRYNEDLKEGRTYSINIGAGATDLHGVAMKESYSWAFSTGNSIDRGFISGKVYTFEDKVKGLVWGYMLSSEEPPNPFIRKGDFITQTDEEGNFVLSYLAEGRYRVFAVNDRNEDLNFSIFTDPVGIPPAEVEVTFGDTVSGLKFQTSLIDTLPPLPVLIQPIDNHHIMVRFNEPLDERTVTSANFRIMDMAGSRIPDEEITIYRKAGDLNTYYILLDDLVPPGEYQLELSGIRDEHLNEITLIRDSSTVFTASALDDTLRPSLISISPADSAEEIPLYSGIRMEFDHPVDPDDFEGNISLLDSSLNSVSFRMEIMSPVEFLFIPDMRLTSMSSYTLKISSENFYGINGLPVVFPKDEYIFTTMSIRQTGNLSGNLTIAGDAGGASIIIELADTESEESKRAVIMNSQGGFEFTMVPRGEYTLSAFLDINSDGKWTKGSIRPFVPSEPFVIFNDVLTVRPGVDNTGNNLKLIIQ